MERERELGRSTLEELEGGCRRKKELEEACKQRMGVVEGEVCRH